MGREIFARHLHLDLIIAHVDVIAGDVAKQSKQDVVAVVNRSLQTCLRGLYRPPRAAEDIYFPIGVESRLIEISRLTADCEIFNGRATRILYGVLTLPRPRVRLGGVKLGP